MQIYMVLRQQRPTLCEGTKLLSTDSSEDSSFVWLSIVYCAGHVNPDILWMQSKGIRRGICNTLGA